MTNTNCKIKSAKVVALSTPHKGEYTHIVDYPKPEGGRGRHYFRDAATANADAKKYCTIEDFCTQVAPAYLRLTSENSAPWALRKRAINLIGEWFPGDRLLSSISFGELEERLDAPSITEGVRQHMAAGLRFHFDAAVKDGYLETNPLDALSPRRQSWPLRCIIAPAAVALFMAAAERCAPELVALFALIFFGGLTLKECLGLTWEQINLVDQILKIMPEIARRHAKGGIDDYQRPRIIGISLTLRLWLESTPGPKVGSVYSGTLADLAAAQRLCAAGRGGAWGQGESGDHLQETQVARGNTTSTYIYHRYPLVGVQALMEVGGKALPNRLLPLASDENCIAYWTILPSTTDPELLAKIKDRIHEQYVEQTATGGSGAQLYRAIELRNKGKATATGK